MRELKFRIWDRKMWHIKVGEYVQMAALPTDVHVMLYTGRKDKDEVEIYDGDILEVTGYWDEGSKEYGSDEPKKLQKIIKVMKWIDESKFGEYDYSGFNFFFFRTSDRDEIKVIGNIYANPELIPQ